MNMYRHTKHTMVLALAALSFFPAQAFADAAKAGLEIAKKNDLANQGFVSERSVMEMKLINAHGDITTRRMKSEIVEGKNDGDKSIVIFEWPADVKGTKMLTHSKKTGDDQQWLFLPAIKRVKRISSRNKSGSFMGSEFSYEDLGSQEIEKFTYELLGEMKFEGRDVWHMKRVPTDKRSGYSKQIVWIDKEYHGPLKLEYYDRKGELLKTATFSDHKKFGKLWRIGKISVTNSQTSKQSIITWSERSVGAEVDEENFDSDNLAD